MDIYLTASQFGKYPGLATSTSVNNCYILFIVFSNLVYGSEATGEKAEFNYFPIFMEYFVKDAGIYN